MPNHDLVVIGGSAGSIEPLRIILANLPNDLAAAVLIVVHVPSNSTGIFATIAAASSVLPVKHAAHGDEVVKGQVFLAPPDHHLLIMDGRLKLGRGPRENLVRPAIDPLMRSAAISHGSRAVGVILSGLLNDGASGLAAIKNAGGIALVQAPVDAASKEMPLAALEATAVDLSGSASELAAALTRYVSETPGKTMQVPPAVRLEVEIAAGSRTGTSDISSIADFAPLTCPDCGGVLSKVKDFRPLRFRCQVGHGYTAQSLMNAQHGAVDEAVRVALRIIEERAELLSRMARDAAAVGRPGMVKLHKERAREYRDYADVLRSAIMDSMKTGEQDAESQAEAQIAASDELSERIDEK